MNNPVLSGHALHLGRGLKVKGGSLPDWLPRVLAHLDTLPALGENWDGCGGTSPRPEAVDAAKSFISDLAAGTTVAAPHVSPMRTGGVLFAWENGPRQLEVEINTPESGSYVYLNQVTDENQTGTLSPGESVEAALLPLVAKLMTS